MIIQTMPCAGSDRSMCLDGNGFMDNGNNVFLTLVSDNPQPAYAHLAGQWMISFRNYNGDEAKKAVGYHTLEDAFKDWWNQVGYYYDPSWDRRPIFRPVAETVADEIDEIEFVSDDVMGVTAQATPAEKWGVGFDEEEEVGDEVTVTKERHAVLRSIFLTCEPRSYGVMHFPTLGDMGRGDGDDDHLADVIVNGDMVGDGPTSLVQLGIRLGRALEKGGV